MSALTRLEVMVEFQAPLRTVASAALAGEPSNARTIAGTGTDEFSRIRHALNGRKRRAKFLSRERSFQLVEPVCVDFFQSRGWHGEQRRQPISAGIETGKIGDFGDLELRIACGREFAQVALGRTRRRPGDLACEFQG